MIAGRGFQDRYLNDDEVRSLVTEAFGQWDLTGRRVLVILPDGTRTGPIPLFFRLLHEALSGKVAALDYLIALGTHQPMSDEAINRLVGISAEERAGQYRDVNLYNHRWDLPETFVTAGTVTEEETRELSNGLISILLPFNVNRKVFEYDQIIIIGPVFPHEVAGFSGGNKYFFPGVSGPEVINATHWLGALITCYEIIGTKHTPVRAMIDRAASFIDRPTLAFCLVVTDGLNGVFIGEPKEAWSRAADLSARVHVRYVDHPFKTILSVMPEMYDDLWVGAKGMYKLEPVAADGGEVIIYAPHIDEVSYTHGRIIDEVGYHVRDYFVRQWDRFKDYPWGVLAHSTHLRGNGTFDDGVEKPRVRVTLATGIPRERCERINLGYRNPSTINPQQWMGREEEGILVVPHAGQILYRLKEDAPPPEPVS
jgi:lactate racemase